MIYYIEGCTCSGKSTLAKELVNYYEGFELAPEHTPNHEKMKNLSLPEKQKIIFFDFLNHFETLRQTGKNYICDFSPWGVIPFSSALRQLKTTITDEEKDQLSELTLQFKNICLQYFSMNYHEIQCFAYLFLPPHAILTRLKNRKRQGDCLWNFMFIGFLVMEYNKLFKVLKDNDFIN